MKIFFPLLIFCGANLISYFSYSQINAFPYFQDFENDFVTGLNTEFINHWNGNEVQPSTRIHKEKELGLNQSGALSVTPTSTFSGIISVSLDLRNVQNAQVEFFAASSVNGTGTYPAKIEISTSIDNGSTFSSSIEVGANAFLNTNTEYNLYKYELPTSAVGRENVVLKLTIKRGSGGSGTVAKILIDDFKIYEEETIRIPVNFRDIQINEIYADPSGPFAPETGTLPNGEFIELYNASEKDFNLNGFSLNDIKISSIDFPSKSFLIACPPALKGEYEQFGKVIPISSWSTLTNTSKLLTIKDAEGNILDSLTYNLSWYKDKQKQEGGWTIEQINPYSECFGSYNYSASNSTMGGTPGTKNSIYLDTPTKDFYIEKFAIKNDYSIIFNFNKPCLSSSIKAENIKIHPASEIKEVNPLPFSYGIEVVFNEQFKEGETYSCSLINVIDCSNLLYSFNDLNFGIGIAPSFNDIIITEIMADPSPTIGLPEVEYVEIFNRTDKIISLKDISFSNKNSSTIIGDELILPGEFILLCPAASVKLFDLAIKIIGLSKWPTLLNSKGELSLISSGNHIFSIEYFASWHEKEKAEGGYALEMIDLNNPCKEAGNWISSNSESGGTPGKQNSLLEERIDLQGPEISSIEVLSDTVVILELNEKTGLNSIDISQISISPSIDIQTIVMDPLRKKATITMNSPLRNKILYSLTLNNLTDCNGNVNSPDVSFALPEPIEPLDIVINEVLFNPRKNGVDFVEFYNRSDKYFNVKQLAIANEKEGISDQKVSIELSKKLLAPKEYFAVTVDKSVLKNEYPKMSEKNVFEIAKLPSFPDQEGTINLLDTNDNIIDAFTYSEKHHLSLLKSTEGVSLERINSESNTNDRNNWHSASADFGFATPGYRNSQNYDSELQKELFSLNPKVFSPDGDGYEDFVLINYSFASGGTIGTIKIFDKDGRKVKTLMDNQTFATEGFLQWDGADDIGKKVPIGIYLMFFEMYDLSGKVKKFKKEVVVAARL